MENTDAIPELQVQVDALRLLAFSLFAAHPMPDAVAKDTAMRLEVWQGIHEQRPVTEEYLQLMAAESERMNQVLENLCAQRRGKDEGKA